MFDIIMIEGEYRDKSLYHPGLLYKPKEQVLLMATRWAGTHGNTGTANQYLKVLSAFCRNYAERLQDLPGTDEIIVNFERYVHRNDIETWMTSRANKRDLLGRSSPTDRTIEHDAVIVCNFLHWAKEELKSRNVSIPYDGGKVSTKRVFLEKRRNFLAGVKDFVDVERVEHGLHLSRKPKPGTNPKVIAKSSQRNGHAYYKPKELNVFLTSFTDHVWTYAGMAAYITGLRPHELLAVPHYASYKNGKFFTADTAELRRLKAKGQTEIIYECLGKGEKFREVVFVIEDWLAIMDLYEPLYRKRREHYERETGEKLQPHNLWLTKPGKDPHRMVQYCLPGDQMNYDKYLQSLRDAVRYARTKNKLDERFGHPVDFYALRHTFVTNFIIKTVKADKALREKADRDPLSLLEDYGLRRRLMNQIGHEDFETTFRHYVDNIVAAKAISFPSIDDLL
jgi:hypothetical protein